MGNSIWSAFQRGISLSQRRCNSLVVSWGAKLRIVETTFFRYLLPPELRAYFWENAHNTFSSKDDHLALSENCLVDIEEVEATGQRELSELNDYQRHYQGATTLRQVP